MKVNTGRRYATHKQQQDNYFEDILFTSILSSTHAQKASSIATTVMMCLLLLEIFGTSINLDLPSHL